jgi:hypothetical protein
MDTPLPPSMRSRLIHTTTMPTIQITSQRRRQAREEGHAHPTHHASPRPQQHLQHVVRSFTVLRTRQAASTAHADDPARIKGCEDAHSGMSAGSRPLHLPFAERADPTPPPQEGMRRGVCHRAHKGTFTLPRHGHPRGGKAATGRRCLGKRGPAPGRRHGPH